MTADAKLCVSLICLYFFNVGPAPLKVNYSSPFANAVSLEILPSGDVLTKSIGSSILLTCKPSVTDAQLISKIQWLDPQGRVIEPLTVQGNSKPMMYTEMHQGNGLALFFNSLQEDQAGTYSCSAMYANTEPLTKNVTIETIIAITWDDAPPNQYPILGEDFPIKCKVRARPSPSVDWLYNGELITTNDHYVIETHSLKIKNVQESDDGIYTCRASVMTTGQLEERAIRVEVHVRPVIEGLESGVEIIEGENANIVCKATGKPPPKFTWVKSLEQRNLASADRFSVDEDTGILTITNANRDDAGEYQCTATNAAGTASDVILVAVVVKPKIMEFRNSTSVVEKSATLTCMAYGRPPPIVTFRKHTSDTPYVIAVQPNDDRITLANDRNDPSGETTAVLTIENLLRSDDGLYECIAQNKGGEAFKTGHLTVEFPPSFATMKNLTIWSWDQRPVNLTCIAESIPNATIRWQHNGFEIDNDPQITKIGNGPISTLTVLPLDKRYYSNYKCIASNIHGTRDYHIILREAYKPRELSKARIAAITATSVTFDLEPPVVQPGLPVRTITVQYRQTDHTWATAKNKTWAIDSPYILEGLTPETIYDFRFSARNDVGDGNWGNNLHESTPRRSFPNEPKILSKLSPGSDYEVSQYSNQFELRWLIPVDNGEPIDLYQIKYCPISRVRGTWQAESGSCIVEEVRSQIRSNYWLKNLKADTFYRVEVRAHNAIEYGPPGTAQFKTARGQETQVMQHEGALISSAAIIGIVIAVLFILIIVVDVICCCANKTGIIFYICERSRRKPVDEDDAKLGSLYGWRFPLPYCDQKMANVAGVTAIQDSDGGKNTIKLVKHTVIDEKEPLREEKKITPIIDSGLRRETSVNFNGKTSVSKTGFVGKDSAV
ncbi:fasciclin-2 isoform X2 [Athalia rosae]|uniref:fasciclin-2 isoform X2 n=1 Tax=Athalia rosae TaxID=37344 RepID=UPI0020342DA4|nr:fasciclin-2 isoform X2 [Athalia rosae]